MRPSRRCSSVSAITAGWTWLRRAVDARRSDGVRLIVALGVDVNAMVPGSGLDRTVLHNAAGWGGVDMVRLLVELGADPGVRDLAHAATPLGWALYNGQREVADYLLASASVFDAVRAGGVERVAALIREDPSLVRARDHAGRPLAFLLDPDDPRVEEMIRLLVESGVDLNARDGSGRSAVDAALARGLTDFAAVLQAHGASG